MGTADQKNKCVFEFNRYREDFSIRTKGERLIHNARETYNLGMIGLSQGATGPTFPAITLLHQSIEIYFKTLLYLNNIDILNHKHHDLRKLYEATLEHYPSVVDLTKNEEFLGLLDQFNHDNFISIRYAEGSLLFNSRHSGKPPINALMECLEHVRDIFETTIKNKFQELYPHIIDSNA